MHNEQHDSTNDICDRGPASALRLPALRRQLTAWARRCGLPANDVDDLVLACQEAMANVVDHAYGKTTGDITVSATTTGSGLVVTVTDYGHWKNRPAGPNPARGRGIQLITKLTPSVDILRTAHGTTIRMRWPLPAKLLRGNPGS